jgi:hypothetical protein
MSTFIASVERLYENRRFWLAVGVIALASSAALLAVYGKSAGAAPSGAFGIWMIGAYAPERWRTLRRVFIRAC